MENKPPVLFDWMLLFLLAAMWGVSFILIKKSLTVFQPDQAAFVRMAFATLVYLPFAIIYANKIDWKKWKPLLVVSLCGSGLPNYLYAIAQTKVSSSLAGILNSLTPFFTLILGILIFKNKADGNKWLGVLLGLTGAILLVLFGRGGQISFSAEGFLPLFCVAATICYAINANTVGKYLREMHPIAIGSASVFFLGVPYLVGFFWSGAYHTIRTHPDPKMAVSSLAYLAVIGTAAASILYFYLVQRTSAIFATSVTYLLPIVAIFMGIWDGEKVTAIHFICTAMILGGLYLTRQKS